MATYLRESVVKCHPCLNKFDNLAEFVGFVALVYAIIALIATDHNTA